MKTSIKKTLSLVLIALLMITTTPAMSFAEGSAFGFLSSDETQTTATVTLQNRTPGSSLAITLTPAGPYTISGDVLSFTDLTPGTSYSLSVVESFSEMVPGPYPVTYNWHSHKLEAVTSAGNFEVQENDIYYNTRIFGKITGWSTAWAFFGGTHYTDKSMPIPFTHSATGTFSTLPAPITYTLNATAVGNGTVSIDPTPGPYVADSTVKLTAIPDTGFQFDGWTGTSETGSKINLLMNENKTITATFSKILEPLHTICLVVGTGGIACVNNTEYGPGTHTLSYPVGSVIPITPYANAGYVVGVPSCDYTVQGDDDETINVSFTSVPKVYGLDYYQTDGFFSGYHPDGSDITSAHNPRGDVLSASMTATPNYPVLGLGDTVSIQLNVTVNDGDTSNGKLNEVDLYQNGVDKQTFGNSPDSNPVTYTHTIPALESELIAAGFTLRTPSSTHNIYTKALCYELVDRYHTNGAAAIMATTSAKITVEVPLPIYTVCFDAKGGSPEPDEQNIISGGQVGEPNDPNKEGFTFDYWTLDGDDEPYDFLTVINEPLGLVAHYTAKEQSPPETTAEPTTETRVTPTEDNDNAVVTITEALTETIVSEEIPLGSAIAFDIDSSIQEETTEIVEEIVEEIIIEEAIPLADALPQTGQIPVELFYGIGGLISVVGVFLKRK